MDRGTYVYCLIADRRRPRRRAALKGLPATGPVRLLEVVDSFRGREAVGSGRKRRPRGLKQWLVVADAPLDRYGQEAINRGMSNLDWVSRAALAHESVIESFSGASAVLPMKLFTIFTSDSRSIAHVRARARRIDAVLKRVMKHDEWGVRVVLDASRATRRDSNGRKGGRTVSGAAYLGWKKAQREAGVQVAARARRLVADLYDRLATQATHHSRRRATERSIPGGPLLLDAAFLVPRARASRFRSAVTRHARSLGPKGYLITLSGPWPPYSFMQA
jgi:hypothetical protein